MTATVQLREQPLEYHIRVSQRAKRKQITIGDGGEVTVVLPAFRRYRWPEKYAQALLKEYEDWVLTQLQKQKKKPWSGTREEFLAHRDDVRERVLERLSAFNQYYNFSYKRVTIRNQKTRWGSCSSQGNLSFNYKMAFLPESLFDYVVVHELCHLKELNHSPSFWDLVGRTIDKPRQVAAALGDF